MQPVRRGAALLLSLALAAGLGTGCGPKSPPSFGGGTPMAGIDPVATVNGQGISQSAFYLELQNYQPNPQSPTAGQPVGRSVLQQLIQNVLLEGLAQQEGVPVTDAQVSARYNDIKLLQDGLTVKPLEQTLQQVGLTPDDLKNLQIRPQLAQLNLLAKGQTVSESEIKSYYDLHKAQEFTQYTRVHIKHIVLPSPADAQAVAAQIKKGAPFENFLPRSLDKQSPEGDSPQWILLDAPAGSLDPKLLPLIQALKPLKINETGGPLQLGGNAWLVKVVDKKDKQVLSLDQVKNIIQFDVLRQKVQQNPAVASQMGQLLHAYQAKANIQIKIPGTQYASLQAEMKQPSPGGVAPSAPAGAPPAGARAPAAPAPAQKAPVTGRP